ncbi:hypothetical protein SNE40_018067 [Patella caerulea]|uniref:Uncharacterized protein n=1 Tax=Patella caerulea TaxID=87958 RepID=A0AAN8JAT2_PATCE
MAHVSTALFLFATCLVLLLVTLPTARTQDVLQDSDMIPEERAFWDQLFRTPNKRQLCRPGFTFNPVIRNCKPSLGVLRGRGRRF